MKALLKKTLSLTIAACMIFLAVPADVFAASSKIPITDLSNSYKNSKYYTKANEAYTKYKNSSDAERFVRIALSQKGYKGSNKANKTYSGSPDKKNIGIYTEYSRYMNVAGKDWCASFVSWSARAAGISKDVIVSSAGCGKFRNTSKSGGKFIKIWSNDFKTYKDYQPKVGDIALYTPTCSTCGKHRTSFEKTAHVVIVCDVADKPNADGSWTFTTIERSKNNTVGSNTLTTKSTRGNGSCKCSSQVKTGITDVPVVQGFFHPNWADGKSAPNHLTADSTSNSSSSSNSGSSNSSSSSSSSSTSSTATINVTLTAPTSTTYINKSKVENTKAVLVTKITKPAGTNVKSVGIVIYDKDWKLVCDKNFTVTNVGKNTKTFHTWYDTKSDLGVTLTPGTKYYYKFYTNVDGKKYTGSYRNFTTTGKAPSQSTQTTQTTQPEETTTLTLPTDSTYTSKYKVESTKAVLVTKITKPAGTNVKSVGIVIYDKNWNSVCDKNESVTNVGKNTTTFHSWYDTKSELGITLQSGMKYYYRFYANVDGVKYVSPYWNFTTKADTSSSSSSSSSSNSSSSSSSSASSSSSSSSTATTTPLVTVTKPTDSNYTSKYSVSSNNAVVVAKITKPAGSKVNYVGLVMYKNGDWNNCVCDKTFTVTNVSDSSTYFHAWYDIKSELGVTLEPNTLYKYKIYTNIDGTKYGSDYWTFTTSK